MNELIPNPEPVIMKVMGWPAFSTQKSNPYCGLLYHAMQKKGVDVVEFNGLRGLALQVDILHVHWPDLSLNFSSWPKAFVESLRCLLILQYARFRGARVVWTAHNLQSHENFHPILEWFFWRMLVWELDGVISLSAAGLEKVREKRLMNRHIPTACIAHGHYRDAYANEVSRDEARRYLGIAATALVVGWVGQIRAYKGLQELVTAWRNRPPSEARVLLIAGQASEQEVLQMLKKNADEDASIHFKDGRVENDDLQYYVNASDVMVMPYRKILNSGSALLSLSFNRPVALPKSEVMVELQKQVGTDWVYLYDGDFNNKILEEIMEWTLRTARPEKAPLFDLEWELLAGKTIAFFREVIFRHGFG